MPRGVPKSGKRKRKPTVPKAQTSYGSRAKMAGRGVKRKHGPKAKKVGGFIGRTAVYGNADYSAKGGTKKQRRKNAAKGIAVSQVGASVGKRAGGSVGAAIGAKKGRAGVGKFVGEVAGASVGRSIGARRAAKAGYLKKKTRKKK